MYFMIHAGFDISDPSFEQIPVIPAVIHIRTAIIPRCHTLQNQLPRIDGITRILYGPVNGIAQSNDIGGGLVFPIITTTGFKLKNIVELPKDLRMQPGYRSIHCILALPVLTS